MIESHELVGAGDLFYVLYLGSYTKNAKMKTDEFRAFTLFPTKLPLLLLAKLHVFGRRYFLVNHKYNIITYRYVNLYPKFIANHSKF